MREESSIEPNFVLVDDENTDASSTSREQISPITSSELEYLKRKAKKLKLFEPAEVYEFKHIEINYLHSFWHALTFICSILLFYGLAILMVLDTKVTISGVGEVSDLTVLDILGLAITTIYPLIKIKQTLTAHVTKFNKRYQLALCANAFNRVNLNYLKLLIFISALNLHILFTQDESMELGIAIEQLFNGVLYDTLSVLWWLLSIIIVVKAFKYNGKGKEGDK